MGIAAAKEPAMVERDIEEKGFGHLHAAVYLHGVERLKPYRQTLFYRSSLHACEVMMNPAQAPTSLLGAAHESFLERFATAAGERGQQRVMVVQGLDGGDELPLTPVAVADYQDGELNKYTLSPSDFGLAEKKHHRCEEPAQSATLIEAALAGTDDMLLDAIIYNAGVRIYLGKAVDSIENGIALAKETLSSGKAYQKLNDLRS
jgi:anthranilate phosphoribosyltransferase